MLIKFTILCALLFWLGYGLTGYLYKNKDKQLRGSVLETKILMWIPIFLVVILFVVSGFFVRVVIIGWILLNFGLEVSNRITSEKQISTYAYLTLVTLGLLSSLGLVNHGQSLFLSVWLMSVLSDVTAFFAGNYFGSHHLPEILNQRKSFEGVIGQIVGALLGFILINIFFASTPFYFVITVGAGSVLGDLYNSYIKRKLGIMQWSNKLPGHGGYLDRFSSLSLAMLLTTVFI